MKFDKETLVKHHFWVLLLVVPVLLLVVVVGIYTMVLPEIAAQEAEYAKAETAVKASNPKGEDYRKKLIDQEKELAKKREEVWKESWQRQKDLFFWPAAFLATHPSADALYFGDPIDEGRDTTHRNTFRQNEVYQAEYERLAEMVKPTDFKGGKEGWKTVLQLLEDWAGKPQVPTNEDIWLALEDLWVQHELMRLIAEINHSLAEFRRVKELPLGPNEKYHALFESRIWQLDLAILDKGRSTLFKGTLKNISKMRQVFGFDGKTHLKVWMRSTGDPVWVPIEAESVPADGKTLVPFEYEDKTHSSSRAEFAALRIEQELNRRTVPIKRIDALAIGYHSHRTAKLPLRMAKMSLEAIKAEQEAKPMSPPALSPPGPGGPRPMPLPNPMGSPSDTGPTETVANTSAAGFVRDRYIDTTPQVRRLPLGIVLVVDQSMIQDVLVAFANSKLRLQQTQFEWERFRESIVAEDPTDPKKPDASPSPMKSPPLASPIVRRPVKGSNPRDPFRFTTGPSSPSGEPTLSTGGDDTMPATLVTLSLYGVASLYERYPPREPKANDPKKTVDPKKPPLSPPMGPVKPN